MKLKSHSGTKKRIKISSKGKIMFRKPCKQHLLINKSKRQKSMSPLGVSVHSADEKRIKGLLPQSF